MIQIVVFGIKGTTPVLMHNPSCMEEDGASKTRTKKIEPREDALKRLYVTKKGNLYLPSIAFLNSLWEGAAYEKIGKDSARSRIQAAVFTADEETVLLNPETDEPIDQDQWTIDSRYVVIKATKGRIMRHRPKIERWSVKLPLEIDSDYIGIDMVEKLFNKAGRVIGVGDFRPAKRGPFGRYECRISK